ncbi:MAG TPA: hypothetical protein VNO33_11680 [Kofleriaceae bacterium]|nr:hypothetical protein [Kofleriaceae bacterium]
MKPPAQAPEVIDAGCTCVCHQDSKVMHIQPCCDRCPGCGRSIARPYLQDHLGRCAPDLARR